MWPFSAIKERRESKLIEKFTNELLHEARAQGLEGFFYNYNGFALGAEQVKANPGLNSYIELRRQGQSVLPQFFVQRGEAPSQDYLLIGKLPNPGYREYLKKIIKIKKQLRLNPSSYEERIIVWEEIPMEYWEKNNRENNEVCPLCRGAGWFETGPFDPDTQNGNISQCPPKITASELRELSRPTSYDCIPSMANAGVYDFYIQESTPPGMSYSEYKNQKKEELKERLKQENLAPVSKHLLVYVKNNIYQIRN